MRQRGCDRQAAAAGLVTALSRCGSWVWKTGWLSTQIVPELKGPRQIPPRFLAICRGPSRFVAADRHRQGGIHNLYALSRLWPMHRAQWNNVWTNSSLSLLVGHRDSEARYCRPNNNSSQKPASSQSFTDLVIPIESQFRAVGIIS